MNPKVKMPVLSSQCAWIYVLFFIMNWKFKSGHAIGLLWG